MTVSLNFLKRRGPDSHGQWSSPDGVVDLLHARLAIVDSDSSAHQPLSDASSGVSVALVGEIYNYLELRAELSGFQFKTKSDTEVILALYVTRGLAGFKSLRGMFALCLVDCHARRTYLIRDPIGKKPLFLAQWRGSTYFGSSVLALLAASGEAPDLNETAAAHFWADGHVTFTESIIKGCTPVRPGEIVELDWSGTVKAVSSCIPDREKLLACQNPEIVRREIWELILQSTRRRLLNNPNPVALLSGGIDSTVVAKGMRQVTEGTAITLGSLVPGTYDEKYARYAGRHLDLPVQVVRTRPTHLADDVSWALDLQDEPLGMISFFPLALMIRAAREYGRILFTGDGGDEIFLGYGQEADWLRTPEPNEAERHSDDVSACSLAPQWMSNWGQKMVKDSLIGHMFTKLDRASAEQGVECRCPLLDWDLVAFVRGLAPDLLLFDGKPKALLKAQLSGWPRMFVNRPKVGFTQNLRWAWAASRFTGLREMITSDSIAAFEAQLPQEMRHGASMWHSLTIFRNFTSAWKLLAWSLFNKRLKSAVEGPAERQENPLLKAASVR